MKKKISPYLKDMIDNMDLAQKFAGNLRFEDFIANKEKYYAVLRCVELVGEAGDRVLKHAPDFEKKHPEVRWDKIIGMRIVMAHHYDKINDQKVWNAIKVSIPETKSHVEKLYDAVLKEEMMEKEKELDEEQEKSPKKTRGGRLTL
ncbi:MAG: hypothetical protein CVT48_01180 [Thermoplasmata archaeon HGW-Thermoplasmata-1]|nr:MAG: hypothetical protein CVT48_01180 [Thermoplasmata archaeon HGW-Thermoplasmata-1]